MTINWGISITFIVIGLMALITVIFLLFNIVPRPPKRGKNTKKLLLTNDTDYPVNVNIDERTTTIPPNDSVQMVLNYGTEVSAPMGNYQIRKNKVRQLILGSHNLHSDLDATSNTRIVNLTDSNIQLRYTTNKGLESIFVPSNTRVKGPVIFKDQKWKVFGAGAEMTIISLPKRIIVWDGKELK